MAKTSEAQMRATKKYDVQNRYQICFQVNRKTEQDIIERLNAAPAKMTYIKELIRADIQQNPHRFG